MNEKSFFFAGGGTGGHVYPALAIAEQLVKFDPAAKIHFFCSRREIDSRILGKTDFSFTPLPAEGFSLKPAKLLRFLKAFQASSSIAAEKIAASSDAVVIGIGGFVAAPVCWAAKKLKIPTKLLNVDIVPGKANKILWRFADEIFVQFDETAEYFTKRKRIVTVAGCPLRSNFTNPNPAKALEQLKLDSNRKILLVTGASSGAQNINETIISLLEKLDTFANDWQIIHLTGLANYEQVNARYAKVKIKHLVCGYYDNMADLLAAAELGIGRSGAVSVAEYCAAGLPMILMPYPHHKDKHQYLNVGKMVEAGAAIIVDDVPNAKDRSEWLAEELEILLKGENARRQMKNAAFSIAKNNAAETIAKKLLML